MQDLSRIWVGFGEEMHFFGGARRVCPGMGSVSGRKCISSVGLGGFVPDLGDFWGGNAFLRGVCPGMGPVSGRKCISLVGLGGFVPDLGDFRGERAFLGGVCPGMGSVSGRKCISWGEVVPARGTEQPEQPLG